VVGRVRVTRALVELRIREARASGRLSDAALIRVARQMVEAEEAAGANNREPQRTLGRTILRVLS